jgi:hypothetical protein
VGYKEATLETASMYEDIVAAIKKAWMTLILFMTCAFISLEGCSSQAPTAASPGSAPSRLTEGKLLLYLSGASPSRVPPPGGVGYTDWGFQVNGFNRTTPFIIYESGYQGAFSVSSSCPSTSDAVATARFSPDAMGPGAILAVTSGAIYSKTTCTFAIGDIFGQIIHLRVGYPG